MHEDRDLEGLSPEEAAAVLAGIAERLAAGAIEIDGTPAAIAGPVTVSVHAEASHALSHLAIKISAHRPGSVSRLLEEELARPGG